MINFKPIQNYPNYLIYENGEVFSLSRNQFLSPQKDKKGYLHIRPYNKGVAKTSKIHRLVAEAFIPNPDNKPSINHIDGNKLNNHVNNLEWATHKEQSDHAWRLGLCENTRLNAYSRKGVKRPDVSEANRKRVTWIHPLYGSFYGSSDELMMQYTSLSQSKLSLVLNNKRPHHKQWRLLT